MRPAARVAGLSPRRRVLISAVALAVIALAAFGGVQLARSGSGPADLSASRPSHVLLVPGYGGSTTALSQLAARIRATGRSATVVPLAGDGTGDLQVQARVLNGYVNQALRDGSGPVTVIGYSAGGVVAWLWDVDFKGGAKVRQFITLGSPLHGASLAALGAAFVPGECPAACQQLVPGSTLLSALQNSPAAARPPWLSLWTTDDQVVQPPPRPGWPVRSTCPCSRSAPGSASPMASCPPTRSWSASCSGNSGGRHQPHPGPASATPCRPWAAVRVSRRFRVATASAAACGPLSGPRRSGRQSSSATWRIPRGAVIRMRWPQAASTKSAPRRGRLLRHSPRTPDVTRDGYGPIRRA